MSTPRVSRSLAVAFVLAAGVTCVPSLLAQSPPGGGMRGMMMPMDRASMEQRLALDAEGLNLTAAQKSQIDKLVDDYIAEQGKMREKHPMTPGSPPSPEAMGAMRAARDNLNAAVGKVMDDGQRKTWEAALAARRAQMGPGGPPPGR